MYVALEQRFATWDALPLHCGSLLNKNKVIFKSKSYLINIDLT